MTEEIIDLRQDLDRAITCLKEESVARRRHIHTKYLWKQKDGSLIKMRNMAESHLRNALKHCVNKESYLTRLEELEKDHERRWFLKAFLLKEEPCDEY